jgi:TolB-like protein
MLSLKNNKIIRHSLNGSWLFIFLLISLFIISGCSLFSENKESSHRTISKISPSFFGISEDLADKLLANSRQNLSNDKRLLVTTLVNLDNLYQTSSFGRSMGEALAYSLFKRGFGIEEIKKSSNILLKKETGELSMTRDIKLTNGEALIEAVIIGTYAVTPQTVIINIKMVDANSQKVISIAGSEVKRGRNLNYLLASSSGMIDSQLSGYEGNSTINAR